MDKCNPHATFSNHNLEPFSMGGFPTFTSVEREISREQKVSPGVTLSIPDSVMLYCHKSLKRSKHLCSDALTVWDFAMIPKLVTALFFLSCHIRIIWSIWEIEVLCFPLVTVNIRTDRWWGMLHRRYYYETGTLSVCAWKCHDAWNVLHMSTKLRPQVLLS